MGKPDKGSTGQEVYSFKIDDRKIEFLLNR
jgi:hypothetical protein